MVIYFGEENDAIRQVKISWLKTKFADSGMQQPLANLPADSLADKRTTVQKMLGGGTKEKVIISGHGDPGAFSGLTAKSLFDKLVSKGLNSVRFESIYLLGCNIGLASQDNSIQQTFLKEFGRLVKTGGSNLSGIKVYGPRGFITWYIDDEDHGSHKTHKVRDVKIEVDDQLVGGTTIETYTFDTGLLRYEI